MHTLVKMVLCVTGTFHLVTIEMCVAVVRKTKQTNKNSDDEDVILQYVSKQLVCSHSSPASSSSHILTRHLSLHPLFFLKEADRKPIKVWDALETVSVGARRDGRPSYIFAQIQQSPNLHACLHMFGPDECASPSAWITRRSNGKCQEMCLFRFLRWGGPVGGWRGQANTERWPSFLATFPPSALMRRMLTVTFTGLFS